MIDPRSQDMAKRALPNKMCIYKHAMTMYRLIKNQVPESEFPHLNFQMINNKRARKISFVKMQRFEVGQNILLNRMHYLNVLIDKNWLSLGTDSYKIRGL